MTLVDVDPSIREYLTDAAARGHRPATLAHRRMILTQLSRHVAGPLLTASAEDVRGWYARYRNASRWTRISYGRSVRAFYGWAMLRGYRADDPTVGLPIPRSPQGRPRPIPEPELTAAMFAATRRMRLWLMLGAGAGLRAGEIARLRREHLSDTARPPLLDVIDGKGGVDRTVIIGDRLCAGLAGWQSRRGRMWDVAPKTLSRDVSAYFRGLGMPWTAHNLRHTYGSRLYQESAGDVRLVQDQLGHRDPKTTAIYTAWSPRHAAGAIRAVDATLPDAA